MFKFFTLLFFSYLLATATILPTRVPAYIRIVPSTVGTDSLQFDISWEPINGVTSYDITFRTMPRIKKLELVRVVKDTIFSIRVHKTDVPYPQIILYATSIASLSGVGVDSTINSPPPPPASVAIDTLLYK